jgi:hypothetical protein
MKFARTIPAALVAMGAAFGPLPAAAHGTAAAAPLFLAQVLPQKPEAQVPAEPRDANRDQFVRQNEGRFEEWGRKIDAFNAKAAERTSGARETTKRELDRAWTEAKDGWTKLKSASREGWQDAKDAFEQSWRKLERAWNDAQS